MNKKIAGIWLSLTMLLGLIVIIIEIPNIVEGPKIIYVDDEPGEGPGNPKENFTSIQEAIDNASEGDTIYVYNGTYYENVVVNKSIDLVGENKSRTIIDGQKNAATLLIRDTIDVSVNNFSIHNGSRPEGSLKVDNASADISYCNINGSRGNDEPLFGESGSPGISSIDSVITLINSSVYGGRGGDYIVNDPLSMAGDGGEGMTLTNTNAMIIGTYIKGGHGGKWRDQDFEFDGHLGENGDGNDAIVMEDSDLTISFCELRCGYGKVAGIGFMAQQAGNCLYGTNSNLTAINNNIRASTYENSYAIFINDYWGVFDYEVQIHYNQITWGDVGIYLIGVANSTIEGNSIQNCFTAIKVDYCSPLVVNTTISMMSPFSYIAFDVMWDSYPTALNTTFVGGDIQIISGSNLTIAWFVNVEVKNLADDPVEDAMVYINDTFGSNEATRMTDNQGCVKWIPIKERVITSSSIINYTPHYLSAIKNTMFGDIFPNQTIDRNRDFIIVLNFTSFYQDVQHGWNLVCIPLFILNTSFPGIFNRINGQYNAVQWYNSTDSMDHWKHYQISKPSHLNDLDAINHTIGFWIYITEQGGTNLVVLGDKLNLNQTIKLHPGWNMVGYPSLSNKNITVGLNNLNFTEDIDAIISYDAFSKKWEKMGEEDYFQIGRGYYIHAKNECVWDVPLQ
ncbi:MAG: hypothetical protein JSW00_03745 [Thermoplasmata archaeon]|nr:MAG: hypothetical protein JSW00_03745 [Thermoplasmata archaeon]